MNDLLDPDPGRRPVASAVVDRLRRCDRPLPLRVAEAVATEAADEPGETSAGRGRHALPEEPSEPDTGEPVRPDRPGRWPDPAGVVTQLRRSAPATEPEQPSGTRRRLLAVAAGLIAAIIAALVVIPLAGAGDSASAGSGVDALSPAVADPLHGQTLPVQGATAPIPSVPASPSPADPGPTTASQPSPLPETGSDESVAEDWSAVMTELDAVRAHALVSRNAQALDRVYSPGSVQADADRRTIAQLRQADHLLAGAVHRIVSVEPLPSVGQHVHLAVVDTLPSYTLLTSDGQVLGRTPGRGEITQEVVLERTPDGYRIVEIRPLR